VSLNQIQYSQLVVLAVGDSDELNRVQNVQFSVLAVGETVGLNGRQCL